MSKHIATVLTTVFAMAVLMSVAVLLPSTAKAQCQEFIAHGSGANRTETLNNTSSAANQVLHQVQSSDPNSTWDLKDIQTTCDHDFRRCNKIFVLCNAQIRLSRFESACGIYTAVEIGRTRDQASQAAVQALKVKVIDFARKTMAAYGWSEQEANQRFTFSDMNNDMCGQSEDQTRFFCMARVKGCVGGGAAPDNATRGIIFGDTIPTF